MTNALQYETVDIALKHLSVIWVKAQRPFNEKWAKQIADEFDPEKFEAVLVTKPNGIGMYHIIEGQHRKAAAEAYVNGDLNQKIPCRIIAEADPARAAELWLSINGGRKAITQVYGFLVAVEAKRELETTINNIVRKCGYRVNDNSKGENNISAVGALKTVYHKGPNILLWTLTACRHLWGGDSHGVTGEIIKGMGIFQNEFHLYVENDHLKKAITNKYKSPGNFVEASRMAKEKSSESIAVAMAELIRVNYNHGLRDNKKLKRK